MLIGGARQGAEIHVLYVGLVSPELHLRRVASRVAAGGHDIPEQKIRERYTTSRQNLIRIMPHLASLRVYDNSAEADPKLGRAPAPALLLYMVAGKMRDHAPPARIPLWAKPILAFALERSKHRFRPSHSGDLEPGSGTEDDPAHVPAAWHRASAGFPIRRAALAAVEARSGQKKRGRAP
jgi:hypothetical protein